MNAGHRLSPQAAAFIAKKYQAKGWSLKKVAKKLSREGYKSIKTNKALTGPGVSILIKRHGTATGQLNLNLNENGATSGSVSNFGHPNQPMTAAGREIQPAKAQGQRVGALPPLQRIQGVLRMQATDEMKLLMIQGIVAGERMNGVGI